MIESWRLSRCFNIDDLRKLAKKRLPASLFGYIDGGSDDEYTLRNNTSAFDHYALMQRILVDVSEIDLSTTVLGKKIDWPVLCAPTGMSRMFHHEGERAVAREAAKSGTFYSLSTLSTTSIEDVGRETDGPKMFQVYVHRDRELSREFVQRAKSAGFDALCLTVDLPAHGNRERDLRTGMTLPPKLTAKSVLDVLLHPAWVYHYLTTDAIELANVAHKIREGSGEVSNLLQYVSKQFDPTVSWEDAEWIKSLWDGPFVIKGIMSVEDAKRAVDIGASAIVISNHGGRQLDSSPATIEMLPKIADAVGGQIELILDSGIRRGTHVLKALALGADACMIGRSYLYGLAAGGQPGVARALQLLRAEIELDMKLMGCRQLSDVTTDCLYYRDQ
ncbi:MAG: alpha-hydroxy-acid oxidizing protein [Gammaproteobacteria bacterium]|nr:MAG: alpha-hydroxy-acid oxidizing protein [Gammaproteobacteria bacterium]